MVQSPSKAWAIIKAEDGKVRRLGWDGNVPWNVLSVD